MDADLRLYLKTFRESWEAFYEPAREYAITRQDIGERATEDRGQPSSEDRIAEAMAWPKSGVSDRASRPYHHVQPAFDQLPYHRRSSRRVIGRVAVGHHIDIGINVCKTPADDVALSWRQFGSNYRTSSTSYIHGIVSRIVVEDINDSRQAKPHEMLLPWHRRPPLHCDKEGLPLHSV